MVDRISSSDRLEQAWIAAKAARTNAGSSGGDVLREARALQDEAARLGQGGVRPFAVGNAGERGDGGGLEGGSAPAQSASSFSSSLSRGAGDVAAQVRALDDLPLQVASGKVESIAELAAQVKSADISFRFALEVRNKLIDAYREVMRMSV
jgi:flagellar hook-basal body complex protein FliE